MLRGTRVANAYVAITADGTGIDDDIKDAFGKTNWGEYGEKAADEFGDRHREGLRKHMAATQKELNEGMSRMAKVTANEAALSRRVNQMLKKAVATGDIEPMMRLAAKRAGVEWSSEFGNVVKQNVLREMKHALLAAGKSGKAEVFKNLLSFKAGDSEIEFFGPIFERAVAQSKQAIQQIRSEQEKADREAERAEIEKQRRLLEIAEKFSKDRVDFLMEQDDGIRKRMIAQAHTMAKLENERFNAQVQKSVDANAKVVAEFIARRKAMLEQANADIQASDQKLLVAQQRALMNSLREENRVRVAEERARAKSGADRDLSSRISGMLGRGSRNDFFHYFGKSVGGVIKMVDRARRGVTSLFTAFRTGFAQAGEGATLLQRVMAGFSASGSRAVSGMASGLSSLAASLPVAAVAAGVLLVATSALVSVLSALLGIVVALSATIVSALTAAIAVASGALVALAAAGGLAAIAFTNMNKEQKKFLKNSFQPVSKSLREIGQMMMKDISPSFRIWGDNINYAVQSLKPLASEMGNAIGAAGSILTGMFSGEGFQKLFLSLTRHLLTITVNMSTAISSLMNGFAGLFAGLMPYVERFSAYLKDTFGTFEDWASSAKGQNEIKDFMDDALVSLESFWRFLKQVGGLLGDLFFSDATQGAGNGMFDGLTSSIETLREKIEDGSLESWMEDTTQFAEDLGVAIVGLTTFLNALNDSGVLALIGDGLRILGEASTVAAPGVDAVLKALSFSSQPAILAKTGTGIHDLATKIARNLGGALFDTDTKLGRFNTTLSEKGVTAFGAFKRGSDLVAAGLKDLAGGGDNAKTAISQVANLAKTSVANGFETLKDKVSRLTSKFKDSESRSKTLRDAYDRLVPEGVKTALGRLSDAVNNTKETMRLAGRKVEDLHGVLVDLAGIAQGRLRTALGKAQEKINTIKDAFHNGKEAANAMKDAVVSLAATIAEKVNSAMTKLDSLGNKLRELGGKLPGAGFLGGLGRDLAGGGDDGGGEGLRADPSLRGGESLLSGSGSSFMAGVAAAGRTLADDAAGILGKELDPDSIFDQGVQAAGKKGGKKGGKGHKPHKRGLKAWAKSLIDNGPSMAKQIVNSLKSMFRGMKSTIAAAMTAEGGDSVASLFDSLGASIASDAAAMVDSAQNALNDAARRILNAKGEKALNAAHKAAHRAQKNLRSALKNQRRVRKAMKILDAQKVVTEGNVEALLNGLKVENATLGDYAEARSRLAVKIDEANQKLADAISTRDSYRAAITDSILTFGDLTTATAKVVNGVQQALSAKDITDNLSDRLAKIKKFQENLRTLVASGLSDAAYKQLLDAGVDQGGAFAEALLAGGQGAISDTNALLDQIGSVADSLGLEASNKLYQAGVDAAQGLVDGLNALSDELDAAATKLGEAIAQAIKDALGIKSPSTVLIGDMGYVGDGAVIGLNQQHAKVGSAASALGDVISRGIAVSPEVAAYAARQNAAAVSGNNGGQNFELTVVTPTEDPRAVAMETMNEITGRL